MARGHGHRLLLAALAAATLGLSVAGAIHTRGAHGGQLPAAARLH
jgi:hypothetical protein